ncbi:ITFG1 [Cordylochernes scorpioides]|uniref:ITFG1 n=1 Tax=Cordylochernes scorpioides TaxID=51811 RepID=A0ABY6L1X4_9ARAC|nr:ITFG1 [Cordylochernes scorpioides]
MSKMLSPINLILKVTTFTFLLISVYCFEDVTNKLFHGNNNGILAAFGDFDTNTKLDLFVITQDFKAIEVLNTTLEDSYFNQSSIRCETNDSITSAVPGDYNGDAMMDILVTTKGKNGNTNAMIFWGGIEKIDCDQTIIATLVDQPLVLDYNSDMIADFLGQEENGITYIWLGEINKNFTKVKLGSESITSYQPLKIPHSSAFIDLNGDLVSDIMLTGKETIEIWINVNGKYNNSKNISYPPDMKHVGQFLFVDINAKGNVSLVAPACKDSECLHSVILKYDLEHDRWEVICDAFSTANTTYGFQLPDPKLPEVSQISLKSSDIDMDGYPDFVAVVEPKKGDHKQSRVVLIKNEPGCSGCNTTTTLLPLWDVPGLSDITNVQLAAFYDIYDDGVIDLLVLRRDTANKWEIRALQNIIQDDACFIKVLVLTGRCYNNCPNSKSVSYGTNQPGPMIRYETYKPNGEFETGVAGQLYQSAYFSLQLPYCLFGLGQMPNFVEKLTISLPMNSSISRERAWTQIIPNSQLVVIPYPSTNPSRWINKLFVTPSHLVIMTGIALLGTCGIIALLIALLHLKEKSEDRREKLQEAHRFNFDAM